MVKFTSVAFAIAVGQAAAAPSVHHEVEKRQLDLAKMLPLLGQVAPQFLAGKGYKFMGDARATKTLAQLSENLGASRERAGSVGPFMANVLNNGYGIVADPPGAGPRRVESESPLAADVPGAKRVKIRYGPYKIPNMSKKNLMGEEGMLNNYPHQKMEKPCKGDCTLIGLRAGLEYADGKNANIDTGLWLHHMVLFTKGPGREDPTCKSEDISLPHATVGETPRRSERLFASGNERGWVNIPGWGYKDVGYKLKATDEIAALVELMNENMEDKVAYMTITYDLLDGHPFKDDLKAVWLDIRQCGTSEVSPPAGKEKYRLDYAWTSNTEGEILGGLGHLHDGGHSLKLTIDGKDSCENSAFYGTKPDFVQPERAAGAGHGHGGATKHISDMPACAGTGFPVKAMAVGQKWGLEAYYDYTQNPGQKHGDGDWDEVMGISVVYVRTKK